MTQIVALDDLMDFVKQRFSSITLDGFPHTLYEPVNYTLSLNSKKIRPLLVFLGTHITGGQIQNAFEAAKAVEYFHTFSLMHDDILDRADMRRGEMAVCKKWDINQAILSGDLLMIESIRHLNNGVAGANNQIVMDEFLKTCIGVCQGQQLDIDFEREDFVSMEEYFKMIRLKTAVLLGFSLKLGGYCAGATDQSIINTLYQIGESLGIMFQLKDDYLDAFGSKEFGKTVCGDFSMNKKTLITLLSLYAFENINAQPIKQYVGRTLTKDETSELIKWLIDADIHTQAETIIRKHKMETTRLINNLPATASKRQMLFDLIDIFDKRAT